MDDELITTDVQIDSPGKETDVSVITQLYSELDKIGKEAKESKEVIEKIKDDVRKERTHIEWALGIIVTITVGGFALIIIDHFKTGFDRMEKVKSEIQADRDVLNCWKNLGYFSTKCYKK